LSFGPFEYDPNLGELRKHRSLLRLQGQPLRILTILLNQAGELVGRTELQRQLWPGATSGDFDHGLNAAVNKLRQTLNDSAEQPRYIETVPGQGYRFIAPLHTHSERTILELVPARKLARSSPSIRGLAVAVAMIVVAAFAYWLGASQIAPASITPLQFTVSPPPGYYLEPGTPRQSFALSPDGNSIAFSAMDESGRFYVFLKDFGKLEPQLLPESSDVRSVFWQLDGKALYFSRQGKLRRWMVGSNTTVIVADALAALSNAIPFPGNRMLQSNNLKSALASAEGPTLEVLPKYYPWPETLPGSSYFITYAKDPNSFLRRGVLAPLSGEGPEIPLGDFHSKISYTGSLRSPASGYLISVQGGTLIGQPFDPKTLRTTATPIALVKGVPGFAATGSADFSVSNNGVLAYQPILERTQFYWIDRAGNRLSPATAPGLSSKFARLSPDGRYIATSAYDVESGKSDLWLFDTRTQAGRKLALPQANRISAVWSPDSRSLVYMRSMAKPPTLAMASIESGATEIPLPEADFMFPTSWSSDGRYVLYDNATSPLTDSDWQSDIFLVDLKDKPRLKPFIQTPFHESAAAFSPGMTHVAFMSSESGKPELYLQAIELKPDPHPVGERYLISRSGAACVSWRPDGKELFYLGGSNQVFSVKVQLSAIPSISTPTPLFQISAAARSAIHGILAFDVSPDGQRFIIPTVSSQESPSIVVIRNWEAVLLPKN